VASHAAAAQAEEWPAGLAERALRRWSYWGEIGLAARSAAEKGKQLAESAQTGENSAVDDYPKILSPADSARNRHDRVFSRHR
jgi:hypothetical protein